MMALVAVIALESFIIGCLVEYFACTWWDPSIPDWLLMEDDTDFDSSVDFDDMDFTSPIGFDGGVDYVGSVVSENNSMEKPVEEVSYYSDFADLYTPEEYKNFMR